MIGGCGQAERGHVVQLVEPRARKRLVRREGQGTNRNPWRYRLENADDAYYDCGDLPPMPELR